MRQDSRSRNFLILILTKCFSLFCQRSTHKQNSNMNSNMNDHAEKLKNGIKILENEENECKEMVDVSVACQFSHGDLTPTSLFFFSKKVPHRG